MQSSQRPETEIQPVRFTNEWEERWDDFVFNKAKNATFLHSRRFYNHNPSNEKDDASLLFLKKGKPVAVFPAILTEVDGEKALHSHQRSTYGGIVFSNETSTADLDAVIQQLIQHAKASDVRQIVIRPSFGIYHTTLSQELDYLLWKNGFVVKNRELELAIDLNEEVELLYADSTKRSVKKAFKTGVSVQESGNFQGYWNILTKNLAEKYQRLPVHSLEEILRLRALVGETYLRLFVATLDGNTIAGILAFAANKKVLHAQYIASDSGFQELRPLNAVIDYIAKKAKEEGFCYFNLGMVTEPGGREVNEGLTRFKEGFGARGVLRETVQLTLNP